MVTGTWEEGNTEDEGRAPELRCLPTADGRYVLLGNLRGGGLQTRALQTSSGSAGGLELRGRALAQQAPGSGFHSQYHRRSPALIMALLLPITHVDSRGPQCFLMGRQRAEQSEREPEGGSKD